MGKKSILSLFYLQRETICKIYVLFYTLIQRKYLYAKPAYTWKARDL